MKIYKANKDCSWKEQWYNNKKKFIEYSFKKGDYVLSGYSDLNYPNMVRQNIHKCVEYVGEVTLITSLVKYKAKYNKLKFLDAEDLVKALQTTELRHKVKHDEIVELMNKLNIKRIDNG